jgi:hypothetical protein
MLEKNVPRALQARPPGNDFAAAELAPSGKGPLRLDVSGRV